MDYIKPCNFLDLFKFCKQTLNNVDEDISISKHVLQIKKLIS